MTAAHTPQPEPGDRPVGMVVDGVETQAQVDGRLVEETLLPALSAMATRPRSRRRAFAFLIGPPGVGKSTLAAAVAHSARRGQPEPLEVAALGIDGFHHPNAYLSTHHLRTDTGSVRLSAVKGAPETFDVASLTQHVQALAAGRDVVWPTYDRSIHDVVPGTEPVSAGVVLLEGNWLLLDEPGWRDLATYADYVIYLTADPELLRERLIRRKVRGGLSPAAAADFYESSDRLNVERVIAASDLSKVDLVLNVQADGTINQGELR